MENQFSLSKERKLEVVAMLIDMAGVDNSIDTSESKYIAGVASQMGLNMEDISGVVQDPKAYVFKSPPDEHERMTILYYLLFLTRADGEITKVEENLCYKAGLKLGFNHNLISDLIAVMKTYLHEDVPPGAMLDKVRKYLN